MGIPPHQRVAAVCQMAVARNPPTQLRAAIGEVVHGLQQPLRVAVAGRLKAGKSTVVNALLGQRVAATDVAECTKVVTEFRYGFPERVEVRYRDGTHAEAPLELDSNGAAQIPLNTAATGVSAATVWLSNDALRELTLIDTPGLASLTPGVSDQTRELLAIDDASRAAIARADALIFLVSQSPKGDEIEALKAFRAEFAGVGASAINAIALLNKADKVGDGAGDSWDNAKRLAARYAAEPALKSVVATVLPLIGLLAETAETGLLTEADVRNLQLLGRLEPEDREVLLLGADAFLSRAASLPRDQAAHLLASLDLYGLGRALSFLDAQDADATSLLRHLRRISGIDSLRQLLDERFGARAELLKADSALLALERVVHQSPHADGADGAAYALLRDDLEHLRLDPAMHALNELQALRICATDDGVRLPHELSGDLQRVLTETEIGRRLGVEDQGNTSALQQAALDGAARWNAFRNGGRASPNEARVADIAYRSYSLLYEAAGSASNPLVDAR